MAVSAGISLVLFLIFYFTPHGTIAHMWGTLMVVISTALMLIAALLIGGATLPRWLAILFEVLIILDILGTGICAWFLETYVVVALMVVGLVGWIAHLTSERARPAGEVSG